MNCTSSYASTIFNRYIKKANELNLSQDKQWLALLHYKTNIFFRPKSIIKTDDFFLSKNGKTSSKDELEETIKAFFIENEEGKNDKYQHPICKFPARFDYLNKKLEFNKDELPKVDCKKFNEFYDEIKPYGISIIFPGTYMNNPASMFGHTLIRIDRQNVTSQLNSIIINYGANTHGQTSGIIYAFNGVFGLYEGFFSATPYYKMTNDYNNLENRDIWEYKLNYSEDEAIFYTKHMWELIFTDIDYYFFRQNCSYLMLESLNVIRPDIDLTKSFQLYTAPIDTVKILKKNEFIINKKYRPSLQKQIQNNSKFLTKEEKKFIKNYIKNEKVEELGYTNNMAYETAYKFLEYNKVKKGTDLQFYRKKSLQILKNINENDNQHYEILAPVSPDNGHKVGKLGISFGEFNNENYWQLSFKPSYHELIDEDDGFDKNSEISFFDTQIRYYTKRNEWDLEKFDFIKIKSFAVRDSFFKPISFSVLFGINNLYNDYKVLLLDVNGGFTFGNEYLSTFFLLGPKANYSGLFDKNLNLGFNGIAGILFDLKYIKLTLDFKSNLLIDTKYNYNQLNIESNFIITKNFLINLKFQRYFYRIFEDKSDVSIGLRVLF